MTLRRGHTLFEVMISLLIMAILASTSTAVLALNSTPEKEALSLGRWLINSMTIANRSGRSFRLICPANAQRGYVEIEWQNPTEKDSYTALYGCRFISNGSAVEHIYTPQWNTLTPAVTIQASKGQAAHYTIVSAQGRMRTSSTPPPPGGE